MTCYSDSLPSFNRIIFDKITKNSATSYLLDYVTSEYEAIISCPTINNYYFINNNNNNNNNNKSVKSNSNYFTNTSNNNSGLPSPPLSSPEEERKYYTHHHSSSTNKLVSYSPPTPPSPNYAISLRSYIELVVKKSRIDTGTLLTSLAYARRLKLKLSHTSKGMECTHHRIFLATLIIVSKYIHDSAIKNKYWVGYAQMFSASEINLMEKQLLQLLDYNLEIKSNDYNLIVNDIVQVHFKNNYHHYQDNVDNCCWTKNNVNLEAVMIASSPPTTTANTLLLNRFEPSPPLLSSLFNC